MQAEANTHLRLASSTLVFSFSTEAGRFFIGRPDAPPLIRDAIAQAWLDASRLSTATLRLESAERQLIEDIHGSGERLIIAFQVETGIRLTLEATLYHAPSCLSLRLVVDNRSPHLQHVHHLIPLHAAPRDGGGIDFGKTSAPLSFFKNGYQSWSYSGILHTHQRDIDTRLGDFTRPIHFNPATPISRQPGKFWGEMFGAIIDHEARRAIVAGQIGCVDQFARIGVDIAARPAALTLVCDLDDIPLRPGQSLASEEMFLQLIDLPVDEPFADYFDAVAQRRQPRIASTSGIGWCSWYHYFSRVREENILAHLHTDWPIELVQVDDGYTTAIGDWLSINAKFPHGMKWLADRVREAGHTPGLWLAPFVAVRSAQIVKQHPDWLIRDARHRPVLVGKGWGEPNYALDISHPEFEAHLRRIIETAVHEWGYPYLKLDFLYAAAAPGVRHDATLTRVQALRRGLEIIRQTAGEETVLLGCGSPLGPAIGLVDAMRIGPDIAPEAGPVWTPRYKGISFLFKQETSPPAERNAARNVLNRSGLHRRWWLNDPDCLIVREAPHRNETETRSWVSLVGLSGGRIVLGDALSGLPERLWRYITCALPASSRAAFPLDGFEREMPEWYVLRQNFAWGTGVVAGIFNWSDRPRRKWIDLARLGLDPAQPHHAFEFWSADYRRVETGELDAGELPAHGCAVVAVRPVVDRPHLVATTFHVSMGEEVKRFEFGNSAAQIEIDLAQCTAGEIWIAGSAIHQARLGDRQITVRHVAEEVWALPVEVDGIANIELSL